VFCISAFTIATGIATSLLLRETAVLHTAQLWQLVVWVSFVALNSLVMQIQLTRSVGILSTTITESIRSSPSLFDLQKLIERISWWPWHFSFSLGFGLASGFISTYLAWVATGVGTVLGPMLIYVLNYFQIGMYFYFLFVLTVVLLRLSNLDLDIYANDPSSSPVVQRIYHASNSLILSVATLVALYTLLLGLFGYNISASFVLASVLLLGWTPPLVLFITVHHSLTTIMIKAKARKLAQIQELIRATETEGDLSQREPLEAIQRLMDYHARIKASPNSMVNLSSLSNLFGSLLLPLIATILGNLNTILALFRLPPSP
jgi:hypothetical protein